MKPPSIPLDLLWDSASWGIALIDQHEQVSDANEKFYEIIHATPDSALNQPWINYFEINEPIDGVGKSADHAKSELDTVKYIAKCKYALNTKYQVSIYSVEQEARGQRIIVVTPLTVKADNKVSHSDIVLSSNRMINSIGYDLKVPLNSILNIGYSLLLDYDLPRHHRQMIKEINKSALLINQQLKTLLDVANHDGVDTLIDEKNISVDAVIKECVAMMQPLAYTRTIMINYSPNGIHDINVKVDETRFKQVILNLLSNAIKYNCEAGTVDILVSISNGDKVKILFVDTGNGFFNINNDNYHRLPDQDIHSAGLGLSVSKYLVEKMGGELGIESSSKLGTRCWIDMNIAATNKQVYEDVDSPAIQSSDKIFTILYIDDNPSNLMLLESGLGSRDDLKLIVSKESLPGIALACRFLPDLILLDIHLPVMDGFGVIEYLKKNNKTSSIPVYAVTAGTASEEEIKAAGFEKLYRKPLNLHDLFQRIEHLKEKASL